VVAICVAGLLIDPTSETQQIEADPMHLSVRL
jgi:hypothetical protein